MIADDFQGLITTAVRAYGDGSQRSQQAEDGLLGPSDIGFCRQKAALMTKGVKASDNKSLWAAQVGTAVHNYVEAALKEVFPDWLVGSIDELTVTATLPNGVTISGHPDIVVPDLNTVLDIKTVDGFEWVKRSGTSQSHKFQRHLYALGCVQGGIFDVDKPVYVGNVYFDRSGKETEPIVVVEEIDYGLTDEIVAWVDDVIYAVKHGEEAAQDIAAPVCERICEFYTVCRGGLPTGDAMLITDPDLVGAVSMYRDGLDMEKEAKRMKDQAKAMLYGVNGSTGEWQVRWTQVGPTDIPGFTRDGYERLDVRKVRGRG